MRRPEIKRLQYRIRMLGEVFLRHDVEIDNELIRHLHWLIGDASDEWEKVQKVCYQYKWGGMGFIE